MEDMLADPALVLDLIHAFRKSQVLFAAVKLELFDAIESHRSPCNAETIAQEIGRRKGTSCSVDGVTRLLQCCFNLGLLSTVDGKKYNLTQTARDYLTKDSRACLTGYIHHSDKVVYKLFGALDVAVLNGQDVWQEVFGLPKGQCFDHVYKTEQDLVDFMNGMHSFAQLSASAVLTAFDLSRFSSIVDLGGGTGAMMAAACEIYNKPKTYVVDLPAVIQAAQKHFNRDDLTDRMSWVSVDFFTQSESLPKGDLYVLSRILHDWDDANCDKLLALVFRLLPPGGAVLICEMLLFEDSLGPTDALLQSLNMLVQTQGRERTFTRYREMLLTAGFEKIGGRKTGNYLDAVIAYKP